MENHGHGGEHRHGDHGNGEHGDHDHGQGGHGHGRGHGDHGHGGHGHGGHGGGAGDWHDEGAAAFLAEMLDLDAEVLGGLLDGMIDLLVEPGAVIGRIVDSGAGTGTGTFALARRFPEAEVIALDMSDEMLRRLDDTARELGLGDRIRTVKADLDAGWPDLGSADLIWASNSMHHLADPDRTLAEIVAGLKPGGRLAVAEMDSFPRFLPDEVGPGLEDRLHAALAEARAEDMPHLGDDWGARLAKAGFVVEAERRLAVELVAPLPAGAGRLAQLSLGRLRTGLADRLTSADLSALDTLSSDDGSESVLHREDLTVRAARTLWIARRPS